ncbi:diaminopimelate decarboxylase, partial [Candidatus Gracilibacteria bacterium]|nr:diaminopimelate decarboxylase [Candidatus Gracilibacteria bacterium]
MNKEVIYYPEEIADAVERFETPFFLYSEARIRDNCRRFRDAFRKCFPDFEALYAVKANNNPTVVKIIMEEEFGLDCSSRTEAWLCKKLGGSGMYTANYTPADELAYARDCGLVLNLDDVSNLEGLEVPEVL